MPDSTRPKAGPVGAPSHSNVQDSVSGSRSSATSGLFGGRGTAFVVLALSLAITIPWAISFQALPGFASAAGGAGAMFLAAGAIIISLLLFALVWILTSTRLHKAGVRPCAQGGGQALPFALWASRTSFCGIKDSAP